MHIHRMGIGSVLLTGLSLATQVGLASTGTGTLPALKLGQDTRMASQAVTATMLGMPLQFEANHGQVDGQVKFISRGSGYTLFLTPTESVMVLQQREAKKEEAHDRPFNDLVAATEPAPIKQSVVRMKLEGANPSPAIDGMEQLPGIVNYFIGNDPAKWRTNIPTFAKVYYKDAYPGIDLAYYGNQGKLEYDFIVAPGVDPNQIKLAFEGATNITVAESGDLVLTTGLGDVRVQKPIVYQREKDGHKTLVAGNYLVSPTTSSTVQIHLAAYDREKPLVIDPTLFYSTYLSGSDEEQGLGIAVDTSGNAYVTGFTRSTNFPISVGAFQPTFGGGGAFNFDAFVTKFNPTGSAIVYSTYIGGSNGDVGRGIATDGLGNAYITGDSRSTNFPSSPGAFQNTPPSSSSNAFVTKLDPTGALAYSTYLGGSNHDNNGTGIAVDGVGNACVAGATRTTNFPTTAGAFQTIPGDPNIDGNGDAFVVKLDPTLSSLVYSTYLGGSHDEAAYSMALDGVGNAYVTGYTTSNNFPTTPGVFQATTSDSNIAGNGDAFVTKLDSSLSALVYSTYLGGNVLDQGIGIAVDGLSNAYVTGVTLSSNFPTSSGAVQSSYGGGNQDAFVTKLGPTGSVPVYSTYLGGNGEENTSGIAVDSSGNAYVTGRTNSTNFPIIAGATQSTFSGYSDIFITKLGPSGSTLIYSSYLGGNLDDVAYGIAVDGVGNTYVTGWTNSPNFPTTAGAFQTTTAAVSTEAFVAKIIDLTLPPPPPPSQESAGKVTGGGTINISGGIGKFSFIVQRKVSGGAITGDLTYQNPVSGSKIKSVSFTSFSITGNTVVFEGTCTDNNTPCTFRATMVDNGEPGTTDTFTISISGGPIQGGTLRSGNVQIH